MNCALRGSGCGIFLGVMVVTSLRAQGEAVTYDVGLDHIILSVTNLARGMAAFTRLTGVVPKRGGQHPGRGTENALVSLGANHYLEILAPTASATDTNVADATDTISLRPVGWALHTRALDHLILRVRAAGFSLAGPIPGSRRTPENMLLEWRTAGTSGPGLAFAPFFIEWAASTAHPSTNSPGGCRLTSWTVIQPDTTRLSAFLRAAGYESTLRIGTAPGMQLVLDCPRGRVSFPS
jgi:glyoxalase-like protein